MHTQNESDIHQRGAKHKVKILTSIKVIWMLILMEKVVPFQKTLENRHHRYTKKDKFLSKYYFYFLNHI